MQGYYFSKPVSVANLFELSKNKQFYLLLEKQEEEPYYNAVDSMSLHELSISDVGSEALSIFHNTIPIAIIEVDGDVISLLRANKDFNDFIIANFHLDNPTGSISIKSFDNKPGIYTLNTIKQCASYDAPIVIDERTLAEKTVHIMMNK